MANSTLKAKKNPLCVLKLQNNQFFQTKILRLCLQMKKN
jgi:hypothetical protein